MNHQLKERFRTAEGIFLKTFSAQCALREVRMEFDCVQGVCAKTPSVDAKSTRVEAVGEIDIMEHWSEGRILNNP